MAIPVQDANRLQVTLPSCGVYSTLALKMLNFLETFQTNLYCQNRIYSQKTVLLDNIRTS